MLVLLSAHPIEGQEARVQRPLPITTGQVFVIDDFNHIVTQTDMGFNYFMGNTGPMESVQGVTSLSFSPVSQGEPGGSLQIAFDLTAPPAKAGFAGYFQSLFGLTDTKVRLRGETREPARTTPFAGYMLNLLDIYHSSTGSSHWPTRSVEQLWFDAQLMSQPKRSLVVKIELTEEKVNPHDPQETPRRVYTRRRLKPSAWQPFSLVLPSVSGMGDFTQGDTTSFNPRRVSLLSFIIEGDRNPSRGQFQIDNIRVVDVDGDYPDLKAVQVDDKLHPDYTHAFLDLVRQTSLRYFLDFAARDVRAGGMVQDRSTFADLLTVGGVGFQLTAYVIAAERGYLSRREAARRTHRILRVLHDYPQGADPIGTLGYQGFFYHLLGLDGLRKQNFDFTGSPRDESLNTVELSTIDTALAIAGVLTARQHFDRQHCVASDCPEPEIRALADAIYARVNWRFMLDAATQQFYLGWKPIEARDDDSGKSGRFKLDDAEGRGQYASKRVGTQEQPATLDFYTDEALLVALLAIASPNPKHRAPDDVFCAFARRGTPFIKTHPGALFTYFFASVWLDMKSLGRDACPGQSIDYFDNTRQAILATRQYAIDNPYRRATLNASRWGLSATEGPFNLYFAEAAPSVALAVVGHRFVTKKTKALEPNFVTRPLEVGTVTVYGAGSTIVHTPSLAVEALWEAYRQGMLHPRFGFGDAFNLDVADAVVPGAVDVESAHVLRATGPWKQFTGFAINHGPMMILIDNYLANQFAPRLFMSYPTMRKTLSRLFQNG